MNDQPVRLERELQTETWNTNGLALGYTELMETARYRSHALLVGKAHLSPRLT